MLIRIPSQLMVVVVGFFLLLYNLPAPALDLISCELLDQTSRRTEFENILFMFHFIFLNFNFCTYFKYPYNILFELLLVKIQVIQVFYAAN